MRDTRENSAPDAIAVPPHAETEQTLLKIWCEVLNLESAGIHDDFFSLGGDSMAAMRCINRSRKCFLELGIAPDDIIFVPSGTLAKASSGKRRYRYFRKMYMTGGLERYRISPIDLMLASAAEESPDRPVEQVS